MSPAVADLLRSATALQCLTLQQPWATAIAELGKDVENRGWAPPERAIGQPLAIHAGLVYDEASAQSIREAFNLKVPGRHTCPRGAVVAVAVLVGWVEDSPSRWAVRGQRHWQLQGMVRLSRPVPCKGAQGLWQLPPQVLSEVRAQVLEGARRAEALVELSPTEGPPTGMQKALSDAVNATRTTPNAPRRNSAALVHWGRLRGACVWCGRIVYGDAGAPPSPHAATIAREAPTGWPECEHGARFLEDCVGNPVVPPCCGSGWAPSVAPMLKAWLSSGGALLANWVQACAALEGGAP